MQQIVCGIADFEKALESGESHFHDVHFDFPLEMHGHYEQEIQFVNCRFTEPVSFVNASFLDRFTLQECHFHEDVNFSHASFERFAYCKDNVFHNRVDFKRTIFNSNVNFFSSKFMGEVYMDRTFFTGEVSFYKVQFLNDVYFHRTYMGIRADFSYATFHPARTASFFSIENSYPLMDGSKSPYQPPVFIFRYVYFTKRTLFTNIDLSHTLFQDSYIIPIVFKNCTFSKKQGRSCFYQESARHITLPTDSEMFERIVSGRDDLTIRIYEDDENEHIQMGDRVTFVNQSDNSETYDGFITWVYSHQEVDRFFELLSQRMPYREFGEYRERLESFYSQEDLASQGVFGFSFKKFDEKRHWQNLEDINRQMKRSLEESRDWQHAGDFYVGEMSAMIQRLKHYGEKPIYRWALQFYGHMTGYCESVYRILAHMIASFSVSILILLSFQPEASLSSLIDTNLKLFIPVFGNNTSTLGSLELESWQNMIMEFQVMWYYLLWLFLALALQRKFRR